MERRIGGDSKAKSEWIPTEKNEATGNANVLNTIFVGVDEEQFTLISQCNTMKEAWDTLQAIHEGTNKVQMTRPQILTSKF